MFVLSEWPDQSLPSLAFQGIQCGSNTELIPENGNAEVACQATARFVGIQQTEPLLLCEVCFAFDSKLVLNGQRASLLIYFYILR